MTDLIQISYDSDRPTVLGRDLHERLNIGTQYTKWFDRMCEYGFTENEDYLAVSQKRLTAQGNETTYTDHQMTLDMAKQICMIQRTDDGRRYREYFLEIEKRWNSPEAVMARALRIANARIEGVKVKLEAAQAQIEEMKPKAEYYDIVTNSAGSSSIRDTAKLFGIPQNRFIEALIHFGYFYRDGSRRLMPYSEYVVKGWFELRRTVYSGTTEIKMVMYAKVTPQGQQGIFKRLKKEGII